MRVTAVFLSVPGLVLAIAIVGALGPAEVIAAGGAPQDLRTGRAEGAVSRAELREGRGDGDR